MAMGGTYLGNMPLCLMRLYNITLTRQFENSIKYHSSFGKEGCQPTFGQAKKKVSVYWHVAEGGAFC